MTTLESLQKDFINLRLGTFIHFNSATVQFHNNSEIIDWEFDHENGSDPRRFPFNEADWNPTNLDCKGWAKAAKAAGCRFAALTTKHHEGFGLWPCAYTDHCVKNGTNKTDVVAEYLAAFREEGIVAGLYFSILDLTHGISKRSCTEEQKQFIKNQLRELLTGYGEIPFIMVDGWGSPWGGPSFEMLPFEEIDSFIKSIQPNCLLMNIGASDGITHTDVVFYENAAGQEVKGEFEGPGVSCNKLTGTWFWRDGDDKKAPTSAAWALKKMEGYFPMNINFMLNISPDPTGKMDDNLAAEFAKIGEGVRYPALLTELPDGWLRR
jgi:alpha-L-fucosidase